MSASTRIHRGLTRHIGRYICSYWPGKIEDIVFIIGCPRSGTSIFGEIISHQPQLLYMYEPRYIWRTINPKLNIWGPNAAGQLFLQENDVCYHEKNQLQRWFHFALFISGKSRLIEKLPLNLFRVRWLSSMFSRSKFIHIVRDGRDVALSLKEAINQWFPPDKYAEDYWETNWNFQMFIDYSNKRPLLKEKQRFINGLNDNYIRALFVWRCCMEEGFSLIHDLGDDYILQLRYEQLIGNPKETMNTFFDFIGYTPDDSLYKIAKSKLHNRSINKKNPSPELTELIAGDALRILGYE